MRLKNAAVPLLGFIFLTILSFLAVIVCDGDATASIFTEYIAVCELAEAISRIKHNLAVLKYRKALEEKSSALIGKCA